MNHTAATIADVMRKRALGFAARGDTIFNGSIIAEELQTWAERLAAVPAPADWQPIETAPEGERVELFNELWEATFGEVQIGQRDDEGKWSFDSEMNIYDIDDAISDDGLTDIDFKPTHWRPLPTRPRAERRMIAEQPEVK